VHRQQYFLVIYTTTHTCARWEGGGWGVHPLPLLWTQKMAVKKPKRAEKSLKVIKEPKSDKSTLLDKFDAEKTTFNEKIRKFSKQD
jgi:hypothetical protein